MAQTICPPSLTVCMWRWANRASGDNCIRRIQAVRHETGWNIGTRVAALVNGVSRQIHNDAEQISSSTHQVLGCQLGQNNTCSPTLTHLAPW